MSNFLKELKQAIDIPIEGEFQIKGRGFAIVVDLLNNGYPDMINKDLNKTFMNKLFKHPKGLYRIIGIEVQGMPDRKADRTAFLLKPVGLWHQLEK